MLSRIVPFLAAMHAGTGRRPPSRPSRSHPPSGVVISHAWRGETVTRRSATAMPVSLAEAVRNTCAAFSHDEYRTLASQMDLIQNEVYAAGKDAGFEPLRGWFTALYEVLLGQSQGPRFGSFAAIFGMERTIALIEAGLKGELK